MTPIWPTQEAHYAVAANAAKSRRAGPFTTKGEAIRRARALKFNNDSDAWVESKGQASRLVITRVDA